MRNVLQHDEEARAARPNFAIYYWVVGSMLMLLLLGVTLVPKPEQVPPELQGVWRTSDPKYSGRSLEISSAHLNIATGEGTSASGFIRHVKIEHPGVESLVTITYENAEGENNLSLLYDPNTQSIHFRNQPAITWTKESAS
jgi:hypothetical protein